jgi:hypothetical protein
MPNGNSYTKELVHAVVDGRDATIKVSLDTSQIAMYVFLPGTSIFQDECRITYKQGARVKLRGESALKIHEILGQRTWP